MISSPTQLLAIPWNPTFRALPNFNRQGSVGFGDRRRNRRGLLGVVESRSDRNRRRYFSPINRSSSASLPTGWICFRFGSLRCGKFKFSRWDFRCRLSYGVMHHSTDVQGCIDEAWRAMKPGGKARIMLYHHPSLTGLMLWLRFDLIRGTSLRETVYQRLENPGTKSCTKEEISGLMRRFNNVEMERFSVLAIYY
jgi:SAM-dependent methyltransferase